MPDEEKEMRPEKEPGEEGEFDAKTYLYIKTHPLDNGSEPLPAGLEFWISPHITIIKPDGTRGQEASVGYENKVEVIVTNKGGIDAVDAYVECFIADPSTSFTPSSCTKIMADYISVPAHGTATLTGRWTPTVDESGHKCLLARVCSTIPPDCFKDWGVFDVVGDRHEAQRNIFIIPVPEGDNSSSFGFQVVNPYNRALDANIRTSMASPERRAEIARAIFGDAPVAITREMATGLHITLGDRIDHQMALDPHTVIARSRSRMERDSLQFQTIKFGILKKPPVLPIERQMNQKVSMINREVKHAVVTIPRPNEVKPGEVQVLHIEQVDSTSGKVIGGICLVLKY
jgi:hypothetical protein